MPFDHHARVSQDAVPQPENAASGRIVGIGSVLGALGASSCCVLPLALFSLGLSGAWLGRLTALAPLQPWMLGATAIFLATGFYLVYRRPRGACAADGVCVRPARRRLLVATLWTSAGLAAIAAAFPYLAPVLLDT